MFPNFSKNFRYVWRVFHFSLWSSRPSQPPAEILHVYFLYAYDLSIVIRNGKIVWKRYIFVIFSLELRISGVAVQRIHQKSKKQWLLWEIAWWKRVWGCFSHFMLLWLCCRRFWGSSEDRYRSKRQSQMLLVCCSLLNSQNI